MDNSINADDFYSEFFISNSHWSRKFPNRNEANRLGRILPWISQLAAEHYSYTNRPFRIIDVGCGRGWLTSALSVFGESVGLEPVNTVAESAQQTYEHLRFYSLTPQDFLRSQHFTEPFDLVVASEVIEHVPRLWQRDFILDLASLAKPDGHIIVTTPRGELYELWKRSSMGAHPQPIEDWLTESQLRDIINQTNLTILRRDRCHSTKLIRSHLRIFHKLHIQRWFERIGYRSAEGDIYQLLLLRKVT